MHSSPGYSHTLTKEIKSIWERSAKYSDLSLSIIVQFMFCSITKARVPCIQCLNVCFTLKWGGERSLFKDPPFNRQNQLCYYFCVCCKCLRWDQESVTVCLDLAEMGLSGTDGGYGGRAEVWIAQFYLAAQWQSWVVSPISLSADISCGSVLPIRLSAVSGEGAACGADATGTDKSGTKLLGTPGDRPLEGSPSCTHASGKVRE